MQQDWRRDPIWTLISVIIALIGLVDFVLSLYPDTRLAITLCSIGGFLAIVLVLLWGPVILLWAQGKERVKSLRPSLSTIKPIVWLAVVLTTVVFAAIGFFILGSVTKSSVQPLLVSDPGTSWITVVSGMVGVWGVALTLFLQVRKRVSIKEFLERKRTPRN